MPIGVDIIGGAVSLVVYAVLMFGVYKITQMASDISDVKDLLRDIRRNTESTVTASNPQSPEALVRAVHSASYSEIVAEERPTHSEPLR